MSWTDDGAKRLVLLATAIGLLMLAISVAPAYGTPRRARGLPYDDPTMITPQFNIVSEWSDPDLTYGFINGTSDIAGEAEKQAVRDGMALWSNVSAVTFTENTRTPSAADIRISWVTGEHGDGFPFDGTNRILAHTFFPTDGDVHFDDAETWTTSTRSEAAQPIDLVTVTAHEIGHSLGLDDSEDRDVLMHGTYYGTRRYLEIDDILGVQAMYGYTTSLYHLRAENSEGPPSSTFRYGIVTGGRAVVGDWNNDGVETVGGYYPPNGSFYLLNRNGPGAADYEFAYGNTEDLPIAGDWDRDGDDTIGLYRPNTSTFYLNYTNANDAPEHTFAFGTRGDVPLAGDWNGDGRASIGVYRPSNRTFYLRNSNSEGAADYTFVYGLISAMPLAGDWNGDGTDTIGLYGSGDSSWGLRNSNSTGAADLYFFYGDGGRFTPITADWDGDGDDTAALFQN